MSSTLVGLLALAGCGGGGDAEGLCRRAYKLFDDGFSELSDEEIGEAISAENLGDPPDGAIADMADDLRSDFRRGDIEGFYRTADFLLATCDTIQ